MCDAAGEQGLFVSWGEREEAFNPRSNIQVTCLWRGAGRPISSYQWDLTVQCLKALGWKQLREAEAGGKGCEPVCAASVPRQREALGEGERGGWGAGAQAGRQARQLESQEM